MSSRSPSPVRSRTDPDAPAKPRRARTSRGPVKSAPEGAVLEPAEGHQPGQASGQAQAREFAHKVDVVRTSVKVSVDLDARIRQEATRRGMTLSAWVREAVEAHLPGGPRQPVRQLLAAGAGRSTEENVSGRIDEILAAEWVPHR